MKSWKGLEFWYSCLEKSLNSVKVLEKYLISLLGLEKSLKFTILSTPDPIFCKIRLFCLGKFCSSSVWEPAKLIAKVKIFFVHEQYFCFFIEPFWTILKNQGDTADFKWQGWSNGGKNQNKKKISGHKINPPKNPMPNFQNLKISRKQNRFGCTLLAGICVGTTTNLQIVLNTPKIPAKLSHPKKSSDHPCHLKFRVPPLRQMKGLRVAYQPVALFCFVLFFFLRRMMTLHIASVKHFSFFQKILTTTLS